MTFFHFSDGEQPAFLFRSFNVRTFLCLKTNMSIDEKGLIELVKRYPLLYDMSSPLYLDYQKKDEAWNEIATVTGMTAYDCKIKWSRLRENYRKALILRQKNPGKGKDLTDRPLKYEKEMSFLNPNFLKNEKKTEKNEEKESVQIKRIAIENSTGQIEPRGTKRSSDTKKDAIQVFFDSIAETVRGFPKKIQIQLKRDIFNLVNNTEASLVNNEDEKASLSYHERTVEISGESMRLDSVSVETSDHENPENPEDIKFDVVEFDAYSIKTENQG